MSGQDLEITKDDIGSWYVTDTGEYFYFANLLNNSDVTVTENRMVALMGNYRVFGYRFEKSCDGSRTRWFKHYDIYGRPSPMDLPQDKLVRKCDPIEVNLSRLNHIILEIDQY